MESERLHNHVVRPREIPRRSAGRTRACSPPQFDTPCFHPNVDQYGNICLGTLLTTREVSVPRGRAGPTRQEALVAFSLTPVDSRCAARRYSEGQVVSSAQRSHGPPVCAESAWGCACQLQCWFRLPRRFCGCLVSSEQSAACGTLKALCFSLTIARPRAEPNNDSPLNAQAAALWPNQEGELPRRDTTYVWPLRLFPSASEFATGLVSVLCDCRVQESRAAQVRRGDEAVRLLCIVVGSVSRSSTATAALRRTFSSGVCRRRALLTGCLPSACPSLSSAMSLEGMLYIRAAICSQLPTAAAAP